MKKNGRKKLIPRSDQAARVPAHVLGQLELKKILEDR